MTDDLVKRTDVLDAINRTLGQYSLLKYRTEEVLEAVSSLPAVTALEAAHKAEMVEVIEFTLEQGVFLASDGNSTEEILAAYLAQKEKKDV